jgi:serine phosphatase RsbU (regulator of sigma subunit)
VQEFPIAPGDRLAFVTDGMLERNAAHLDVAKTLSETRDLHPREVVHELGAAVLQVTGGDLHDDATVLVLDWYGGPTRLRDSMSGASRQRASPEADV